MPERVRVNVAKSGLRSKTQKKIIKTNNFQNNDEINNLHQDKTSKTSITSAVVQNKKNSASKDFKDTIITESNGPDRPKKSMDKKSKNVTTKKLNTKNSLKAVESQVVETSRPSEDQNNNRTAELRSSSEANLLNPDLVECRRSVISDTRMMESFSKPPNGRRPSSALVERTTPHRFSQSSFETTSKSQPSTSKMNLDQADTRPTLRYSASEVFDVSRRRDYVAEITKNYDKKITDERKEERKSHWKEEARFSEDRSKFDFSTTASTYREKQGNHFNHEAELKLLNVPEVKNWRRLSESLTKPEYRKENNNLYNSWADLTSSKASNQPMDPSSKYLINSDTNHTSTLSSNGGFKGHKTILAKSKPTSKTQNNSQGFGKALPIGADTGIRPPIVRASKTTENQLEKSHPTTKLSPAMLTAARKDNGKLNNSSPYQNQENQKVERAIQDKIKPPVLASNRVPISDAKQRNRAQNRSTTAIGLYKSTSQPALQNLSGRFTFRVDADNHRYQQKSCDVDEDEEEEIRKKADRVVNWLEELDRISVEPPQTPNIVEELPTQTDTAIHVIYESD